MGKIIKDGIVYAGTADSAAEIRYDNKTSGLNGKNVQTALDDLSTKIGDGGGITLTQAEYDALPDDQKVTGTYYITDADEIIDALLIGYNNKNSGLVSGNIQNAIDEVSKELTEGLVNAQAYTDKQISLVTETGIPKLMVYPLSVVASTENQTTFEIALDSFDANTDTVLVQSGRTMLFPNQDFTIDGKNVVLNEGVPSGRTIGIYVFKNVPMGDEGSVSGSVISAGSIPMDRLEKNGVVSEDFGTNGGLFKVHAQNIDGVTYTALDSCAASDSRVVGLQLIANTADPSNLARVVAIDENENTSIYKLYGEHNKGDMPFLPLDGSKSMTGNLNISRDQYAGIFADQGGGRGELLFHSNVLSLVSGTSQSDSSNQRLLRLANSNNISDLRRALALNDKINGAVTSYTIFGEHNKPFGSYTGNGSATERTINIGGLGSVLYIGRGADRFALVTNDGAICKSDTNIKAVSSNNIKFNNGVLTLKTNDEYLNANGDTFYYRVL